MSTPTISPTTSDNVLYLMVVWLNECVQKAERIIEEQFAEIHFLKQRRERDELEIATLSQTLASAIERIDNLQDQLDETRADNLHLTEWVGELLRTNEEL